MRKFLMPFMALFLAVSCSNDDDTILDSNNSSKPVNADFSKISNTAQINSEDLTKDLLGKNFVSSNSLIPDFNKENLIRSLSSTYKKAPTLHGPFAYTVPVPSPNPTNQKVIYTQVGNTYPTTGVYYADVYNYFMKAELPAGAVGAYVESIDNPGYANYTTQATGFNSSTANENGKSYVVANTYTMVLRYNSVGQAVNAVVPAASGPKTFTYYYFTL
ncbi:hypothetical protein M2347_000720 [Chryseobacterium sp. H1D6B]|uniref:hypothetical protein n=1 Tax=Chryseobacterium sp. H1D6B TaxID=2940588 RepID=UPI0015CE54BB|nr:hypothetical protein [Chryseobacterium sp. H1D6B]MDH6250993.1 hypothetical protein [Chryseobacterium sp. H1D6B]